MAIDVIANIANNIPHLFAAEGRNLWNREAPLLSKCVKERGRSTSVFWTVANGANTAVNPGEGDDIQSTEYNQDDRVAMTLSRGIYRSSFGFTHTELAVVASLSSNPESAADIIRDRLRLAYLEGLAKLANKIEQDMFNGTGTATSPLGNPVNNVVGLLNAIKTTGSYGGQTLASNPGLVGNVQSIGGNVSRANLDLAFAQIEENSGTAPDFIMCSPKTATYLKGIADDQIRYMQTGNMVPDRELGLRASPLSMGPSVMSYNNVPIFQNSAWFQTGDGDGYVVMGRLQDFVVDYMPYAAWGDAVTDREQGLVSSNGEAMDKVGGIPTKVYAVAKTGSSVKFAMECELQMKLLRPNATALLTGITGFTAS